MKKKKPSEKPSAQEVVDLGEKDPQTPSASGTASGVRLPGEGGMTNASEEPASAMDVDDTLESSAPSKQLAQVTSTALKGKKYAKQV